MSPEGAEMLVKEVAPLIAGTVHQGRVRNIGCEDDEELVADGLAMAAQMIDSAERKGRRPPGKSIAYYTLQALKSGRRSGSAGRTDVLGPAAQLDRHASVASLDAPAAQADENGGTLGDLLVDRADDPSVAAARAIDWEELIATLGPRPRAVLQAMVQDGRMDALARQFGVSAPVISQIKRALGREIKARWGAETLADAVREPAWHATVNAARERAACQHARREA